MMTAVPDRVIVIGLGANIGDDAAIVARFSAARAALAALGPARASPIYRTAPIGGPAQRDYLNAAVAVSVEPPPTPDELIAIVRELERGLGRDRRSEARNGPRAIDLDVLVWGDRRVHHDHLVVPHPRLAARRFALAPLVDLLGDVAIPGTGSTAAALLARTADQRCGLTDLTF